MVLTLIAVVLVAIIAIIVAVGNSKHNKKLQMQLEQAWAKSDDADNFAWTVSRAISGDTPPEISQNSLTDMGLQNYADVQSSLAFLYALKKASRTMTVVEIDCLEGSVARKAQTVRQMVANANKLSLMVSEFIGLNTDQMLADLRGYEHNGNVSKVKKSVSSANDTLEQIFKVFQNLNIEMTGLGVSREEVGISDSDPLAGFLDTAQKIADQKTTEADLDSTDEQSDTDDDNN